MTKYNDYDLAVIGAGPAGIVGATTAASLGARVILIDRYGDLGGAGANTGTVPSKTLRETALALSGIRSRDLYGVDLSLRREATIADLMRREHAVKEALNRTLAQLVESSSVELIVGDAQFENAHTICIQSGAPSNLVHAETILIATGSSPNRPPSFPFGQPGVYDSDTILELDKVPKSLAVVGAGAVGSEYACTFAALGTKVHLIDGRDVLLPFLDSEVSAALTRAMRQSGIQMLFSESVAQCDCAGQQIALVLQSGRIVETEAVLVAAGRRSNTRSLNLTATGLTTEVRGDLKVDRHYRTAVPHIYAAGDVIGFPGLASTSMQQARRAMSVAFGGADDLPSRDFLPSAVYTIPEVAMAGDTEQAVHAAGVDYVVGRARYTDNPRGCIIGEQEGFLKLILRRHDLKLLGVHAIGEGASELVHIGLIAMTVGCDASVFSDLSFNVPTLGALYQDATWRLFNESRALRTSLTQPYADRQANPDGYQYSRFCELYRRWQRKQDVVLRQEHKAGEKLFVDWAGTTIPIHDSRGGPVQQAHLFVAVLGASSYTYAEATADEQLASWISAHVRAFEFYQGVPRLVVPDNTKTGVTKACRYDPDLNPTYQEMAMHYGVGVVPARPYKPRDKAKVESGVQLAERWIIAALRHRKFFSIEELNQAIRELRDRINQRPFRKREGSRASQFVAVDKPAMGPLPAERFDLSEWSRARVNIDYHIAFDTNYYSVPYNLVQELVEVRSTPTTIEIFHKSQRVASHLRARGNGHAVTIAEHRPRSHQAHLEWTPSRMVRWAQTIGPNTARLFERILADKPHPEMGYRGCLGIIRLAERYSTQRVEAASERALITGARRYKSVESILRNSLDQVSPASPPPSATPLHDNIRGAEYFE